MAASEQQPRMMSAREHAQRASELASAIQPASKRFTEVLADPQQHTMAIATGAIEAHNAAIEHAVRMAELHAKGGRRAAQDGGHGVSVARIPVPEEPLELDAVLERWPTIRQSWASAYDDCALSSWLMLRYGQGWNTTPQARGTIFHRTAAEILRTMQENDSNTIPRQEALAILVETCRQEWKRDEHGEKVVLPASEIVRVPLRQMPELRMAVDKFAKDNQFSIEKIVNIEKQLAAPLRYPAPGGGHVERWLSGTLDVLLFAPPDEAIVIDWKDTWALPPEPRDKSDAERFEDDELAGLSFHGYFQQRWYGWLVMSAYRTVNKVTLREFYPRKTKVRKATLHRGQLPEVEQELGILIAAMDEALMSGRPRLEKDADGIVMIEEMGRWAPQPGRHCGFCTRPTSCPIPEDVRVAAGPDESVGAATSLEAASRWAARYLIADRIRTMAREAMKGYVETSGTPIPVKWAKGRGVMGWYMTKRGRRFGFHVPSESDRGTHHGIDQQLIEAMKSSTERARQERGVRPKQHRRARA